jgi:hypothetical protein
MLGVIATLLVALGGVGVGARLVRRWSDSLDPALEFGVGGLVGLGVLGTVTFFIGLIPSGFGWGVWLVGLYGLAGLVLFALDFRRWKLQPARGPAGIALLVLVVATLFTLVSVLAPSTADDWDSLAYHLAVPKLWLEAGHMFSVPSLHQSNFPDVIDDLYVWGLSWGGQSGAKAFSLVFLLLGMFAIFGLARRQYGEKAGWWAAIAFATTPALLWEAGTAYIDLGHGLFAGLGITFAAIWTAKRLRGDLILAGVLLGFAAASKYTGLETIFVVAIVIVVFAWVGGSRRQPVVPPLPRGEMHPAAAMGVGGGVRSVVLMGALALAIASPWYIRNAIVVHNPVYPFLYERLGGANWDQRRADIYRREQQTFGVGQTASGGHNPLDIGHAILGLAYQPGRYVNPREDIGLGTPTGAIGLSVLAGLVLWPIFGLRRRPFETTLLAVSGPSLLIWFFLSQQSRYLTTLAPPGAILLGGAVAMLPLGAIAACVAALQGAHTFWLLQTTRFVDQMQVVLGKVPREFYEGRTIPFFAVAQKINENVPKEGKLAMYDEVFGYLLDVPYMWANPGHSTIIPYDAMQNGDDYVDAMKKLGFTNIYVNTSLAVESPVFDQQWMRAMGLAGPVAPFPPDVRNTLLGQWETKWKVLIAEAAASGKLRPVFQGRSGILFAL